MNLSKFLTLIMILTCYLNMDLIADILQTLEINPKTFMRVGRLFRKLLVHGQNAKDHVYLNSQNISSTY